MKTNQKKQTTQKQDTKPILFGPETILTNKSDRNLIVNLARKEKLPNKWSIVKSTLKKLALEKSIREQKLTDKLQSQNSEEKTRNFIASQEKKMKTQTEITWLAVKKNSALISFLKKKKQTKNKTKKDKILQVKKSKVKQKPILALDDKGLPRHFLSATKEWFNSIYTYNRNEMRSVKGLDLSVSKLIKTYFNSIPNSFFLKKKRKRIIRKKWQLLTNKVYLSKSELKHTSSKVTITLYLFAERNINLTYIYKYLNKQNMNLSLIKETGLLNFHNFCENYPHLTNNPEFIKKMRIKFDKYIINFEKYLKLEKKLQNLINFLENKISKFYQKKVVIKIIRLKYLYLNNQMLAEYIALKLISKKRNLCRVKRKIFKKIKFPYVNKFDLNKIRLARRRIWVKSFRNESHGIRGNHIWDDWKNKK